MGNTKAFHIRLKKTEINFTVGAIAKHSPIPGEYPNKKLPRLAPSAKNSLPSPMTLAVPNEGKQWTEAGNTAVGSWHQANLNCSFGLGHLTPT